MIEDLKKDAAKVSASMATALLVYSGISLKMLVDQRLDAALHTMFMEQPDELLLASIGVSDGEDRPVRWHRSG